MKKHIITLGGLPGSGKSTIGKMLAEKLNYRLFSIGEFVRLMAVERDLSLEAFNELVANDKSFDLLIDEKLQHLEAHEDFYIVDSHLAFHFIPSGFSVFLDIKPEISFSRVFNNSESEIRKKSGDTMKTLEEAKERTQKRIENHIDRYKRHYGVNPYSKEQFDLVVDAESMEPTAIVDTILKPYKDWIQS